MSKLNNKKPISTVDISDGHTQTKQKRYYYGRGNVLNVAPRGNAVYVLHNPIDSGVNVWVNRTTLTNLSKNPLVNKIILFTSVVQKLKRSAQVANSNTSGGINRKGKAQIFYGTNATIKKGGVDPFLNSLTPYETFIIPINGSTLIAPGQSRIIELTTLTGKGKCCVSFNWWETPIR